MCSRRDREGDERRDLARCVASTTACNATRSAICRGLPFCNCYLASGAYTIPHGFEYLGVGQCIGPRFRALSYESAGGVRQCERACLRNPDCTAYEVNPVDRACHYFVVEIDAVPNRLITHTRLRPPAERLRALPTVATTRRRLAARAAALRAPIPTWRSPTAARPTFAVATARSTPSSRRRDRRSACERATPPFSSTTRVDGSFLTEVHVVGVTARGRRYTASFWADGLDEHQTSARMVAGACGDAEFALGAHAKYACDGETIVRTAYASAAFELPEWTVVVTGLPVYRRVAGPHHRLGVAYTARVGAGGTTASSASRTTVRERVTAPSTTIRAAQVPSARARWPRAPSTASPWTMRSTRPTRRPFGTLPLARPSTATLRVGALSWAERPTLASKHDPLVQAPRSALARRTSVPVREWYYDQHHSTSSLDFFVISCVGDPLTTTEREAGGMSIVQHFVECKSQCADNATCEGFSRTTRTETPLGGISSTTTGAACTARTRARRERPWTTKRSPVWRASETASCRIRRRLRRRPTGRRPRRCALLCRLRARLRRRPRACK